MICVVDLFERCKTTAFYEVSAHVTKQEWHSAWAYSLLHRLFYNLLDREARDKVNTKHKHFLIYTTSPEDVLHHLHIQRSVQRLEDTSWGSGRPPRFHILTLLQARKVWIVRNLFILQKGLGVCEDNWDVMVLDTGQMFGVASTDATVFFTGLCYFELSIAILYTEWTERSAHELVETAYVCTNKNDNDGWNRW